LTYRRRVVPSQEHARWFHVLAETVTDDTSVPPVHVTMGAAEAFTPSVKLYVAAEGAMNPIVYVEFVKLT
jgi:hypothetical protein